MISEQNDLQISYLFNLLFWTNLHRLQTIIIIIPLVKPNQLLDQDSFMIELIVLSNFGIIIMF